MASVTRAWQMRVCFLSVCLLVLTNLTAQWSRFEQTPLQSGVRFDDIYFTDRMHGSLVTGDGFIHTTFDGGRTWTASQDYDVYFRAVEYVSGGLGFAGSLERNGPFLVTRDSGRTWVNIADRLPGQYKGICGITHVGDRHIYAVGLFASPARFFRSEDAGETWSVVELDSLSYGLVDVHFLDSLHGFICGTGIQGALQSETGNILETRDGGNTWRVAATTNEPMTYVWKFSFVNDTLAFAAVQNFKGDRPAYLRTTDGGANWTYHEIPWDGLFIDVQGIGFTSPEEGWICGYGQGMYHTTDGGETWIRDIGITSNVNRLMKVDADFWVASGSSAYFLDHVSSLDGSVSFDQEPMLPHSIEPIRPNPAGDTEAEVSIVLDWSTRAQVDLYEITGRHIMRLSDGKMPAGRHSFRIPADRLKAGTYVCTVRTFERHLSARFVRK